jgi:hypothetical protein
MELYMEPNDEWILFKQEQAYVAWKLTVGWTEESSDPLEILINLEEESDND